jgi:NAD(P)-dependent dehydrogenase (short-subunit alcohol dehydrogenase family)
MKDFAGKTAVITGGGTGMGRELAKQLVAEGCNVAMCDVSAENMAETKPWRASRTSTTSTCSSTTPASAAAQAS